MCATAEIDLVRFLGREFVAFVAARDVATLDEGLRDPGHPDHAQVTEATARCKAILSQHGQRVYEVVASVPPGSDVSVGNALRLASGGVVPDPPDDDEPLVRDLAVIAGDVFPALLTCAAARLPVGGPHAYPVPQAPWRGGRRSRSSGPFPRGARR